MDDTKLNMLKQYLAMNWALVPLHHVTGMSNGVDPVCSCRMANTCRDGGKHPRLGAWQQEANLVRTVEALRVWPDETNWGVATGPASGIWVIDVDPKNGGTAALADLVAAGLMQRTRRHWTGSGGQHLLYRLPPAADFVPTNSRGALPEGVDIRGRGGYVVVPPSVSGKGAYTLDGTMPAEVSDAFPALLDLIRPKVMTRVRREVVAAHDPDGRWARYARRGVDARIRELADAQSGRNNLLFPTACRVIELCNAPWAELDLDEEYGRWRDAGLTHPLGISVPLAEVDGAWCRALAKVCDKQAEPPEDRPWPPRGDVDDLDFLVAPVGSGTAAGASGPSDPFAPISSVAPGTSIPTAPVTVEGFTPVDGRWTPVDISDVLDGTAVDVLPELGRRQDGIPLLYRGKEHSVAGEPESGKTWFALLLAAQVLLAGGRVVYVDFEDDARTVVGRLLKLGVLAERLRAQAEQFRYVRPETGPVPGDVQGLLGFPAGAADLLVYDGYTEGAALAGRDIMSQNDIALWRQALVKPALDLGCATLVTDHVIKDKDTRGRYAIGAQHKLAGLTGVQFLVDVVETWGKGARGRSKVIITKDRNGGLRPHGQATGTANHTHIGDLVGDASSGDMTSLILWPPFVDKDGDEWDSGIMAGRPAKELVKHLVPILSYLEKSLQAPTSNDIAREVSGGKAALLKALEWLSAANYVAYTTQGTARHYVITPEGTQKLPVRTGSIGSEPVLNR